MKNKVIWEIYKYVEFKHSFLNNQCVKINQKRNRKYIGMNENEDNLP